MPSLIISSHPPQPAAPIQGGAKTSGVTPLASLVIGESLDVRVIDCSCNNKVLLQIRNSTLVADSPLPLQIGNKLTVRVDQLNPNIVLRIIGSEDPDTAKVNEFVKLYRSNPGAMKDMVVTAKSIFNSENLKELSNYISPRDIQTIHKVLDRIIISRANVTNPLFPQDVVRALGLMFERKLMKALSDPSLLEKENNGQNLKESLLKLSSDLQTTQTSFDFPEAETKQRLENLSSFADRALTVIESLQVVNVLAQEQDGLCLFQIPFQLPDGIRIQDVFIEKDREQSGKNSEKSYRVVLFLDMDALGDFTIDASVKNETLKCVIKGRNQDALDFISLLLPELKEKLSGIGYVACDLKCAMDKDIHSWKLDFLSDHKLYSRNTVDVCV
jgi:hypothetical protein